MRMTVPWLVLSSMLAVACYNTASRGVIGGIPGVARNDPRPKDEPRPTRPARMPLKVTIEPSPLPSPLRVGESLVVTVGTLLESGTACYTCTVNWRSDHDAIARWTSFSETGGVRTATLQPITPGEVKLTIEVCPGVGFQCELTIITRYVVRR